MELDLCSKGLKELPSHLFERTDLVALLLEDNCIGQLPEDVKKLSNLQRIILDRNRFNSFPEQICALKQLRSLHLDENNIDQISLEINKLVKLEELFLDNNRLRSINCSVFSLKHLKTLYLGGNEIKELPRLIGMMIHLEVLHMPNNLLQTIPHEIGSLRGLKLLNLDDNLLREVPASLRKCRNVLHVFLRNNRLTDIPKKLIDQMGTKMFLQGNPLASRRSSDPVVAVTNAASMYAPPSPRRLSQHRGSAPQVGVVQSSLSRLSQHRGSAPDVQRDIVLPDAAFFASPARSESPPGSAAAATDHSVLNLQSVQLTNEGLLEALSRDNMTFKQMLLDYNALTSLPLSICKMRTLTELYINNNQLQELPNEIGQLVGLKLLHVENNELSSLPSSISECVELTELFADGNKLQELPRSVGRLRNLQHLNLDRNELEDLPSSIGGLKSLKVLSVTGNQLTSLPPAVGKLQNVEWLYADSNHLSTIPPQIGKMKSLKQLHLQSNDLRNLPDELSKCKLELIRLEGNPHLPLIGLVLEQVKREKVYTKFSMLREPHGSAPFSGFPGVTPSSAAPSKSLPPPLSDDDIEDCSKSPKRRTQSRKSQSANSSPLRQRLKKGSFSTPSMVTEFTGDLMDHWESRTALATNTAQPSGDDLRASHTTLLKDRLKALQQQVSEQEKQIETLTAALQSRPDTTDRDIVVGKFLAKAVSDAREVVGGLDKDSAEFQRSLRICDHLKKAQAAMRGDNVELSIPTSAQQMRPVENKWDTTRRRFRSEDDDATSCSAVSFHDTANTLSLQGSQSLELSDEEVALDEDDALETLDTPYGQIRTMLKKDGRELYDGSAKGLWWWCLQNSYSDSRSFLLVLRNVMGADEALDVLFKVYCDVTVHHIRSSMLEVLQEWLQRYFLQDFSGSLLPRVIEFLNGSGASDIRASEVKETICEMQREHCTDSTTASENQSIRRQTTVERGLKRKTTHVWNKRRIVTASFDSQQDRLIRISPLEFGDQLTLLEATLFQRIDFSALGGEGWRELPTVKDQFKWFNEFGFWIASIIVTMRASAHDRANLISFFISVAARARDLSNFVGVLEVTAALSLTPVRRLRRSWAMVSRKQLRLLNELTELMDGGGNYAKYRQVLKETNSPCIPFFGVIAKDLTAINDLMSNETEEGRCNFAKIRALGNALEHASQLDQNYYMADNKDLQEFIKQIQPLAEDSILAASRACE